MWHSRLGHPSSSTTSRILKSQALPCNSNKLSLCHHCSVAKAHSLPFLPSVSSTSSPLELVHSDVWGPAPLISNNEFRYYVLFIDDYTRYTWIYFLKSKDELVHVFSLFKAQIENLLNSTIKILRSDGGTEYKPIARLFPSLIHQTTCPYTPQQNGISERKHRHIVELSIAIMVQASIPDRFWDDIFSSAVYLINRQPSINNLDSPFFSLFHKEPDYNFLRVLGCLCFPYIRHYNSSKLQPRSLPCVFLGYASTQKGYKCFHLETKRLFISRHVTFDELTFPFKKFSSEVLVPEASVFGNSSFLALLPSTSCSLAPPSSTVADPALLLPHSLAPPIASVANPASSQLNDLLPGATSSLPIGPSNNSGASPVAPDPPPLQVYSRRKLLNSAPSLPVADPNPLSISFGAFQQSAASFHTHLPSQPKHHSMVTRTRDHTRKPRLYPDHVAFLSTLTLESEPKTYNQAKSNPHWVDAMTK